MASALLEVSMTASAAVRANAQVQRLGDLRIGEQIGFRSMQMRGVKLAIPQPLRSTRVNNSVRISAVTAESSSPVFQDSLKRAVAKKAVELVKPGMIVGLGTGSTASMAIEELGKLIAAGKLKDVMGVGTSYQARVLARQFGVKTVDLNDVNVIDIAFDGADEVDGQMNLIKGGGAAHTMEKVVNTMAKKTVILVDQSKVVSELGLTFPVPVEVLPFAISPVLRSLVALGGEPEIRSALRKDGPVITDLGNMVVDVRFPGGIKDPADLERRINMIPGVVENGLFVGIVETVLVATKDAEETVIIDLADYVKNLQQAKNDAAEEKASSS
ncbi:ribose 5-phosphate isomerase A [Marchantia polymorpha subsp. ruderalis]|nr:hypothetical protein MARPO_0109s0045 [Marchantia polymorpha]PTQ31619.1 hypothetical protein MARPO_0109s0045 [Marchantia polymorpha]BBN02659.1 hypothetical protein Mp_2g17040 [Marchantia polymorpha subsp. ruderalis]BBN02660.1 hypothetical protein Mp_2g17040 [Marchantia polymorpha subsp. ruderalis]|eukprot:PTQ31618.1 hypothetical protein MARPO_0109s0045 [Marchantia polymorpha]